ncbi:MAG: PAS domain S-box protein [Luteolibacter sp.]
MNPQIPSTEEATRWLGQQRGHFDQLVALVEDYAIFMMSVDGTILDWNLGADRLKGYRAHEIIGENFSKFYSQEDIDRQLPQHELQMAYQTGKFVSEGWRYRKDGARLWASITITAIRTSSGEIAGFLKITRDLTERKHAEDSLRASEERLRLLIESVQDYAIFLLDPEGHVMSWNTGARRIKFYTEEEILGAHFSIFYPPEAIALGLPESLLREALRSGRVEDEGWRIRKDGSRFWANVIITALHGDNHELRGFAKITRDLTDRRQSEALREAGRRKDVFLATLAHELRNPLAPILTAVDMLQRVPEDPQMVIQIADVLQTQVGQMSYLIDDLLDMARITSGKIVLQKVRIPLSRVINDAVQAVMPALTERGHEFLTEGADKILEIDADPCRLTQILTNLLSNAVKYTPPGGRIVLTVLRLQGGPVEIRIRDNGVGVPPALRSSIFELFDQGASGTTDGLGIGLTIVKSLTELHGGSVSVVSEGEGCGSEFVVKLPVADAPKEEPPLPKAERPPVTAGPRRILIADDAKNAADILSMFMRMEGYEVAVAYDGAEAVETAGSFSPDFVFLDLGMPRLDGYEAARLIRKKFPAVILIALSGWGAHDDRRRTAEAGFDRHLVKPATPLQLRAALEPSARVETSHQQGLE